MWWRIASYGPKPGKKPKRSVFRLAPKLSRVGAATHSPYAAARVPLSPLSRPIRVSLRMNSWLNETLGFREVVAISGIW